MRLSHWLSIVVVVAAVVGCTQRVPGPLPPDPANLSAVRVTPIAPAEGEPYEVAGATSVASIRALSESGWVAAGGRRLAPLYRLDLMDGAQIVAVYWLGTNAHPPQFPCYRLCSGWWIGGSTTAGEFDTTRYKGLTSVHYVYLLADLRVPW